jgi:hypothetical protein
MLATAALFLALTLAALAEQIHHDRRTAQRRPLCPCPKGCGRPAGQHVEPLIRVRRPHRLRRLGWLLTAALLNTLADLTEHRRPS